MNYAWRTGTNPVSYLWDVSKQDYALTRSRIKISTAAVERELSAPLDAIVDYSPTMKAIRFYGAPAHVAALRQRIVDDFGKDQVPTSLLWSNSSPSPENNPHNEHRD